MSRGGFTSQVMLCWPADRTIIDQLNSRLGPEQRFSPTIEHSLTACDACERDVWIGPQQRQLAASPFIRATQLCLYCAGQVQRILRLETVEVDINLDLRTAPRRTV